MINPEIVIWFSLHFKHIRGMTSFRCCMCIGIYILALEVCTDTARDFNA